MRALRLGMEYNCTDREKKGKDRGAEDFMCIIIGGEEMGDFHVLPTFLCNYHHFTYFYWNLNILLHMHMFDKNPMAVEKYKFKEFIVNYYV